MSSDVKWIKISTDIFNDEKIKVIEKMPDGKTAICIWFKLLCLAGRTNKCGWICLADKIPYTEAMLASIFDESENTIRITLDVFEQFGMIEYSENGVLGISNWGKHQAVEGLEEVRAKGRERTAKWRANKLKALEADNCDVTCDVTVTSKCSSSNSISNSLSLEPSIEVVSKDKMKPNNIEEKTKEKNLYLEFVRLTDDQYNTLVNKYGEQGAAEMIEILNNYLGQSQKNLKKYTSHYHAINGWVKDRWLENHRETNGKTVYSVKEQEAQRSHDHIAMMLQRARENDAKKAQGGTL